MNFNSKIAQMKVFATDKGINDLKKLTTKKKRIHQKFN